MTAGTDPTPRQDQGTAVPGRRVLDRANAAPAGDDLFDGEADPLAATYHLRVDGTLRTVAGAALADSLLAVLRERLGITSVKDGCEQGRCGSCSVLLDEKVVTACTVLAADAVDARVTTLAGLPADGLGPAVQAAFLRDGAVQCGFCTPGFVVAVTDLLGRRPDATEEEIREALAGNICRCTGYGRILAAVRSVQAELAVRP
ncbi:(2Fe-2S)-binding protein [Frankia sp. AgB1.9]|uniref:(2Fe-2S)-binding protein n=1 Tax=unclassified Frankia TaxID=2632575 RepID=UPI00193222DA|nr:MULTISPECIES: (2Fe-2S)-binding protein [unclassified Frankia]MBL7492467.1 (2Fe-2S)-binding protein [Frankia sp. AgW1.1]MBL7547067.1 (2Fe-2S)-binding protein [Frankia sp. AgB1.9]MBL7619358.1 (2Fe-2S)-binding protein [Frankia sp. AgB1.8]